MAPKRPQPFDAVVMVLDVGPSAAASGYLDKAIKCASDMVQRKVYSESTADRYGLVLFGTRRTDNDLNYPHISVTRGVGLGGGNSGAMPLLASASGPSGFDLVEHIEKNVKSCASDFAGNWLEAVLVAIDIFDEAVKDGAALGARRIVLLSDMGHPASDSDLWKILEAVKRDQVEFTFILPDWAEDDEGHGDQGGGADRGGPHDQGRKPRTKVQEENVLLIEGISAASPMAECCDLEVAGAILDNKERRRKRPFPWKVDLEIGSDIRIPICGYIQTKREPPKTWKTALATGDATDPDDLEIKPEVSFVRNNEDQTVVDHHELIQAYKYGSKICPVSSVDKEGVYDGGPKSFSLIGFVKRGDVPLHLLLGEHAMLFKPDENDEYSVTALSAIVEAMVQDDMAAIVRKVYRKGCAPRLGALVPEDKESPTGSGQEIRVLVFVELPFMEDIRFFQFAPLWSKDGSKGPSQEQLDSVDNLIDAMMLGGEGPDGSSGEDVKPEQLLNPYYQHLYRCLTSRALHPSKGGKLPKVEGNIKAIMTTPPGVAQRAGVALKRLAECFPLKPVVFKKAKLTGNQLFGSNSRSGGDHDAGADDEKGEPSKLSDSAYARLNLDNSATGVNQVGTTTPVEDMESMLKSGFSLGVVGIQMEKVINSLVEATFGDQVSGKVVACLAGYRRVCIELKSASLYNTFMADLKQSLLTRLKKRLLWSEVVENHLGLISRQSEPSSSDVSAEEAESFLLECQVNKRAEGAAQNKTDASELGPTAEDLLDDL